ncbi:putative disease resistance RPP13-like protein 1 [Forsythia ovata]|uniref:Disease resistance RPP13-like protein 1 n=1 Tax=Forsythia ovata TaxID=205694 RepID=A0ABD1TP11_9LAMI
MAIGEVFLGAFVTVLLERLASRELLKFLRPLGIDAQLKKWRRTLLMIKAVLTDAENKQTRNEAVKEWLNDLEDLAYDLDDLVDKLNTEALQRKLMETDEESTSQVQKLFSTFSNNFSIRDFISESGINSELQEINERLEDLAQQISMLSLVMNVKGSSDKTGERLQLTSVVEQSEVHGREKDKEDILKMLLEVESSDSPVSVIPIVGMGGIGKTTLAQLVYNDDRLKGEFDLTAWACVSDEFDAFRITKIILEKVSGSCDYTDLDMLQVKLKESLSKKRFLVVLDDVWNEKYGDWDILRRPFLAGEPGSKIIVTTRNENVAKIMSRIPAYHLSLLSDNDALSLLDDMLKDNLQYKISEKVRHLSFISHYYKFYDRFSSVNSFQSLRTFLPLSIYRLRGMYLPRRVLLDVVPNLYRVRDLSLSGYRIYELPSSIGDLRHLRYFNLSRTPLKLLPESVSKLCNLQVLILKGCNRLSKLPARMDKLINLRHLNISATSKLCELSEGIARLTSLQTLSKLIVSKSSGLKINELRDFSLLKGEISIEELQHVVYVQEATDARLTNKPSLNKIRLEWSSTFDDSRNEILELDLRRFYIRRCPKLVSLPTFLFPSLCELSVEKCNEVVLNSMHNLTSLTQLKLVKIYGLRSVVELFEQFPLKLENFEIDDCEDLVTLWPSENIVQRPVNLQKVSVKRCPKLLSIQKIGVIGSLHVDNCASLALLPDNISSCRDLTIMECPSLKMMTSLEDCSTSLERLYIRDWVNLNLTNLMGSFHNYSSLTRLIICDCDGLESFPQGGLPIPNLRVLEINGCRNLRSLPDRMEQLLSLENLNVQDCPSLTEFFHQRNIPQGGLPIPNLRHLSINGCRNLRSLPDRMEQLLSLQNLYVVDCPSLTESFNIPPSLKSLYLYNCGVKPLGELDMHKHTSLESFYLNNVYPDLVSFSNDNDQHYLLPPSLKTLDLCNLPNLETLSKGFQNLSSLRHLILWDCPKLVALPMKDQLYNLQSLRITNCPLLKKRCLRNEGDYWSIIADIPEVQIDDRFIQDPESCP